MFKRASFRRGSSSSGPPAQEEPLALSSADLNQQQQQQASSSSTGSLLSRFKSATKVPQAASASVGRSTTGVSPSRTTSAGQPSARGTSPSPAAPAARAPPSPTASATAGEEPVYASGSGAGYGPGRRSRANTLPTMVESGFSRPVSVSSSRSSFTSVSSVAADEVDDRGRRALNGNGKNGHSKPGGGVWAEEEEEGRRPLVELASDDDDDEHRDELQDSVDQSWPGSGLAAGTGPSVLAKPLTSTPIGPPNGHAQPNGITNGQSGPLIPGLDDAHRDLSTPTSVAQPSAQPVTNGSPSRPMLASSTSEQPVVRHSPAAAETPVNGTSTPVPAPAAGTKPPHTHHHAHHHTPSAHAHSPPVASPPPIRAATLSGLKDVASIAAASLHAKEAAAQQALAANGGKKKKMGGGFMSSLSKKLRDPSMEGALALASLPANVQPAEELTPQLRMERAKQAERAHLLQICMELGVEIYDIAPDGHCMYAAVADQLHILKVLKEEDNNPRTTRAAAADYMLAHPDAFLPFLVGSADLEFGEEDDGAVEGETEAERFERRRAVEDDMMSERAFKRYCDRVRDSGEWGGEPEILALSRYYQMPIHVIQSNHPKIVVHSPDPKAKATLDPKSARKIKAVRISYHRRLYGLGEHYNSLRKITYTLSAFSAMVPM